MPLSSSSPSCILVRDPRRKIGGFETWVETLARGLPGVGIQTIVLVPTPGAAAQEHWRRTLSPATVIFVAEASDLTAQARSVLYQVADLSRTGICGVFFTMGYDYINVVGLNLDGSGWKTVPVMHGMHPSGYEWACLGPPCRIVVFSDDAARVIGGELRRRMGTWRSTRQRIVVIPHGVPLPQPFEISRKLSRPTSDKMTIAAVSRLDVDGKRPWDYLEIARAMCSTDVPFVIRIAGDGPSLAAMKEHVRSEGLDTVIEFLGALSRKDVYQLLLESDVFVATSEWEAFGLSTAEAMACCCAIICSDVPGAIEELVTETVGHRIRVGDIEGFRDALCALAKSPESIRKMGRAAHHRISNHYAEEVMIDGYATLMRDLHSPENCDPEAINWRGPFLSPSEYLASRGSRLTRLKRWVIRGW